jgi:hypothetical protein
MAEAGPTSNHGATSSKLMDEGRDDEMEDKDRSSGSAEGPGGSGSSSSQGFLALRTPKVKRIQFAATAVRQETTVEDSAVSTNRCSGGGAPAAETTTPATTCSSRSSLLPLGQPTPVTIDSRGALMTSSSVVNSGGTFAGGASSDESRKRQRIPSNPFDPAMLNFDGGGQPLTGASSRKSLKLSPLKGSIPSSPRTATGDSDFLEESPPTP